MDSLDSTRADGVVVGLVVDDDPEHEALVGPEVWDDRIRRLTFDPNDTAAIPQADVDAWCVVGTNSRVRRLVSRHGAPALFVVGEGDPDAARLLKSGHHDVLWSPCTAEELDLRLHGVLARRHIWNETASMLVRGISHDFRSPLQALALVLQGMERGTGEVQAADLERLARVLDTCEHLATAVGNMGHHPRRVWKSEDAREADLGAMLSEEAASVYLQGRADLDVEAGLVVNGHPQGLRRAVSDLLYLIYRRLQRRQRISVQGAIMGGQVVVRMQAPSYPAFLEHLNGLMHREDALIMHWARKPVPFTGLAYAREAIMAAGGSLTVGREDGTIVVELRIPHAG